MKLNKKTIAVSTASLVLVGGLSAYAYITTSGTGTGAGTVAAAETGQVVLHADFTGKAVFGTLSGAPGTTKITWVPVYAQNDSTTTAYRIDLNRSPANAVHLVGGTDIVDATSLTSDDLATTSTCGATLSATEEAWGEELSTPVPAKVSVPANTAWSQASPTNVQVGWLKVTYTEPSSPTDTSACNNTAVTIATSKILF
jgi:hypothetical protein